MSDTDLIRVAVIGAGYLGRFHAQKYAAFEDVDLVGVCDVLPECAESVAVETGCAPLNDYRELLGKVDAVSVVVPTHGHFEVARAFIEAGADVLVEKPFTATVEEADELIELADSRGRLIQVGHLERFNPVVQDALSVLDGPMFFECNRIARFKARSMDVDVVMDLMIHDIDLILSMVNDELDFVHAVGIPAVSEVPDLASVRLAFKGGCVANVTASRVALKEERLMRVFQPNAYLRLDLHNRRLTVIRAVEHRPGRRPKVTTDRRRHSKGDPLFAELRAFVDCVTYRVEPGVDGRAGRQAVAVALDIVSQVKERLEDYGAASRRGEVQAWVGVDLDGE